ncbi:glycoside hydrolase family 57 protein [Prolixibacter sp. SD074]|jgi:alpha-amylase|uniref:glycoside hydrolase family 57 protein n=1 Tax=Prolixibacter sp. SD074 TaxID=2652391 RepID=UPI00127E02C5|nr:glycoside hydrolase family 57 protein [Prolixibacter sp. SD074]GET30209.1 alpha-amylase [Prolixibacter sp. SD074]
MKSVCLYFQIHQPFRYRKYRFFDIGNDHYYYDDYANETILRKVANNCYLPANKVLLEQLKKHKGKFKVALSISGIALEQFELYAPEVLLSFQELAETGYVEFLSETYSHSLVSLFDGELFEKQVKDHDDKIEAYFGQRPAVFRNTEMIYSDEIGDKVYKMGFKAMLTEGAKHVLGWKSPNFLYCNAINPRLKVLMRNYNLSDDISFRFSNKEWNEYPLTAEKFLNWMTDLDKKEEMLNLFMDYETFGEHQTADSGILKFLKSLPEVILKNGSFTFDTPSEIIEKYQPISAVHVPHSISWADEERDLSAWLGNELQEEAFGKLYDLKDRMLRCTDQVMIKDWNYLQISDHFYYMCTKFFSDGEVHKYFNPYATPYEAFINYMNVLSDFRIRLNALVPESDIDREISALKEVIDEKDDRLRKAEEEVKNLKNKLKEAKGATLPKVEKKKKITKTTGKTKTKNKSTK